MQHDRGLTRLLHNFNQRKSFYTVSSSCLNATFNLHNRMFHGRTICCNGATTCTIRCSCCNNFRASHFTIKEKEKEIIFFICWNNFISFVTFSLLWFSIVLLLNLDLCVKKGEQYLACCGQIYLHIFIIVVFVYFWNSVLFRYMCDLPKRCQNRRLSRQIWVAFIVGIFVLFWDIFIVFDFCSKYTYIYIYTDGINYIFNSF